MVSSPTPHLYPFVRWFRCKPHREVEIKRSIFRAAWLFFGGWIDDRTWPDLTWLDHRSPHRRSPKYWAKIMQGMMVPSRGVQLAGQEITRNRMGGDLASNYKALAFDPKNMKKHEIYVYIQAIYTSTSRLWGSRYTWKLSMNWTQAPLWSRIESSTAKEK